MGMATRPNLQEWLEAIQGCDDEDRLEEEDDYIPLLFDPPFCTTCRLEKESASDSCWNVACWESPVYDPTALPLSGVESALPVEGRNRLSALAQSPRRPGFLDYSLKPVIDNTSFRLVPFENGKDEEDGGNGKKELPANKNGKTVPESSQNFTSRFTAGKKRAEQEMIVSPLVSYTLRAPNVWLASDPKPLEQTEPATGYFGAGWKDGLDFEEPGLPHGEENSKSSELALDHRWKRGLVI